MVRACHASCRSALQKAVEEGLIRINPAIGCKLPPKKSGEMNILTQEEMQRFLIQAKQDGYYELFLLELGTGFAFLGNQYHLNVGGDDFYIDLLFYNLNLRCYVVIELKTGEFKPEYAGQLNFYLSAVDGLMKQPQDNPTIGLLLCKSKNNLVAEYSLKDMSKPIGVSEYRITSHLPAELEKQLPSVEDIQKRIN